MKLVGLRWLATLLIAAAATSALVAGGLTSDSKVKVTASAADAPAAGRQIVTVKIAIDKGWHLYANPVKNETLEPTQTVVVVKSKGQDTKAKITYPAGILHEDKIVGNYYVYEGKVDILADVPRAAGDGPLEIEVKVNACTSKTCLRGSTIKLTVP